MSTRGNKKTADDDQPSTKRAWPLRLVGLAIIVAGLAWGWSILQTPPAPNLETPTEFLTLVDERRYEAAIDMVHPRCDLRVADLQEIFQGAEIDYQLQDLFDTSVELVSIAEADRRRYVAKGTLSIDGEKQPGISISLWSTDSGWAVCTLSIIDPALVVGD